MMRDRVLSLSSAKSAVSAGQQILAVHTGMCERP